MVIVHHLLTRGFPSFPCYGRAPASFVAKIFRRNLLRLGLSVRKSVGYHTHVIHGFFMTTFPGFRAHHVKSYDTVAGIQAYRKQNVKHFDLTVRNGGADRHGHTPVRRNKYNRSWGIDLPCSLNACRFRLTKLSDNTYIFLTKNTRQKETEIRDS
jgi:hypothetical protein